ncbi:MAG: hypothetical protein CVV16_03845 [Gammaproteobacteria bacterium HGW-Gammaproteobacteria-6]|nr:MAG: hypothetical protein CVV16_03845 [Gammaproteobacteria bacterium HGW-Gammaproteobacteria-6]
MDYATLKARQRGERDQYPESFALRVHRALSWLQRAELADDADGRLIFLWIAFNAAYATDIDPQYRLNEQDAFKAFLGKLCELDTGKKLDQLVWQHYSQAIRVLLDNPFVFQSYWDHQRGQISAEEWKERFEAGKHNAAKALSSNNTAAVLGIVSNRLYTLRNQLMHGGATLNSSVNRDQMRDCVKVLGDLVPVTISIMLDSPNTLWGDAVYPVAGKGNF